MIKTQRGGVCDVGAKQPPQVACPVKFLFLCSFYLSNVLNFVIGFSGPKHATTKSTWDLFAFDGF